MKDEQVITNKERLRNLENYVGSINKNVKSLDNKVDNLNIQFVKLSTEITTEQKEHERVLSNTRGFYLYAYG